ncbi:MAG: alcohol dehydrogenase catalytic domain-containing protein [Deltaproteobacteria bacterium]|nr:alcohol dehydrogenase catalytic domain-containing protein [Deltaproteobacteria bacterium]
MKAVLFTAPEKIEIRDVPKPQIGDQEVLAKVAYAGFCGTDIDLLTGEMVHIKNGFTTYPLIPGHEWSGTVEEVGAGVRDFKPGDKVTSDVSLGCGQCDYCRVGRYNLCPNRLVIGSYRNKQGVFAQYISVPQRHLYKIPDALDLKAAALVEPAGTAAYAVKRSGLTLTDTVMVIGDGPIGQLAAQLASLNGAARVLMTGSWDKKLRLAKENGVSEVINYHHEDMVERAKALTFGQGPEAIIETSGNSQALKAAIKTLKPGGVISLISWYESAEVALELNNAIAKDCQIIGNLASPNTFAPVLSYMAENKLKVDSLITHVEPLENIPKVIEMIRAKKEYRIKVLLTP